MGWVRQTVNRSEPVPAAKGTMMLPEYDLRPRLVRKGTEPGVCDSARKPIRPIMARRPLLISVIRPLAFFSGDLFLESLKGSYKLKGTGWGMLSKVGK